MQPSLFSEPWNSLEFARLVIGILTPLTLAGLGFFISRRLKQLDLAQWKNQKLLEKRIAVYDMVAPQLNQLLCFFTWVGYWKSISPKAVIQSKRDLDKTMNVYRHLFDDDVYVAYQSFIQVLFETYTGIGHDARIRSVITGADGNRITDSDYEWQEEWDMAFSTEDRAANSQEVRAAYQHLMSRLSTSFGVTHSDA